VDKEVNIVYEFHHQLHSVTVSEKDGIMIPKEGIVICLCLFTGGNSGKSPNMSSTDATTSLSCFSIHFLHDLNFTPNLCWFFSALASTIIQSLLKSVEFYSYNQSF